MSFSNWTQSSGDISSKIVPSVFLNGSNAIAGSLSGIGVDASGVWYSSDAGKNWSQSLGDISNKSILPVYMNGSNALAGCNNNSADASGV